MTGSWKIVDITYLDSIPRLLAGEEREVSIICKKAVLGMYNTPATESVIGSRVSEEPSSIGM